MLVIGKMDPVVWAGYLLTASNTAPQAHHTLILINMMQTWTTHMLFMTGATFMSQSGLDK